MEDKSRKKESQPKWEKEYSVRFLKKGAYNSGFTVLMVAIVAIINILVSYLDVNFRQIDISRSQIYELGPVTRMIAEKLDKKIEIYVIEDSDTLDARIENMANKYADLSNNITVSFVDPIENPSFAGTHNTSTSSVLVKCPNTGKQQTIPFTDIIQYDEYAYYNEGEYVETAFDAEGQITGAINYVTSLRDNMVYLTTGHNEQTFSDTISKLLVKSTITTQTVDLSESSVPADCQMLVIYGPTEDFTAEEMEKVSEYIGHGGCVSFIYTHEFMSLKVIDAFLTGYGLAPQVGYAGDSSRNYQDTDYYFFPVLSEEHVITKDIDNAYGALMLMSKGFVIDNQVKGMVVEPFMSTGGKGTLTTPDESRNLEMVVGATVTVANDDDSEGKLIVYGSDMFINESVAAFSNLENTSIFMNSVAWAIGEFEKLAIDPKNLQVTNNVMTHIYWYFIPIIGIPVLIMVIGIFVRYRRQKR